MRARSHQLKRLQRIIDAQTVIVQSDLDLAGFMQMIVDTLQELTDAKGAVIEFVENEWMVYRCASGLIAQYVGLRLLREGSLSGKCVEAKQALCCMDAELDDRVDREACRRIGVRSMICSPLYQSGTPIGVLKVMSDQVSGFDEDDVQTLDLLAGVLGAAMAKQLVFDSLQQAEMRLRVLLENASDAVISVDAAGRILRWNAAAERMFDISATDALGTTIDALIAGPCPALRFIFSGIQDAGQHSGSCELPIPGSDGMSLHVEFNLRRHRFGSASELTAFVHDVTDHKRLEQSMREIALTDGLTGVANRRKIVDVLEHALERGKRGAAGMALLFMDLNGFKGINDTYGHDMGDHVLKIFAARLQGCTRASDIVGRLGGDEFVVLAEGIGSEAEALAFADKIAAAVSVPIADTTISPVPSIGISMYDQQADAHQWLNEADKAMYQAKRQGDTRTPIAAYSGVERISF